MLRVSYCDRSVSVVHPPSSVPRQLFALNDFSSKTAGRILKLFHSQVPWVILYQNCSNHSALLNKMAARAKNRKTFKRLPSQQKIWDQHGPLMGFYMGTPYGTGMGFATRFHVVPTWANPYGSQMGTIWVLIWIWPKWPMSSQPL